MTEVAAEANSNAKERQRQRRSKIDSAPENAEIAKTNYKGSNECSASEGYLFSHLISVHAYCIRTSIRCYYCGYSGASEGEAETATKQERRHV